MPTGIFISFEGIDGCGKSTQAGLCADWFALHGAIVRRLREPGGTALGEYIRGALLDTAYNGMSPESELLLYLAARAQLTSHVIKPALENGDVVILDRYIDSTAAYQGYARGLGIERVTEMNHFATGGLVPNVTFVIDIDPEKALCRLSGAPDRLESEGISFMSAVREGYRKIHESDPERIVFCDGSLDINDIHDTIINEIMRRFGGIFQQVDD